MCCRDEGEGREQKTKVKKSRQAPDKLGAVSSCHDDRIDELIKVDLVEGGGGVGNLSKERKKKSKYFGSAASLSQPDRKRSTVSRSIAQGGDWTLLIHLLTILGIVALCGERPLYNLNSSEERRMKE